MPRNAKTFLESLHMKIAKTRHGHVGNLHLISTRITWQSFLKKKYYALTLYCKKATEYRGKKYDGLGGIR